MKFAQHVSKITFKKVLNEFEMNFVKKIMKEQTK